MKSKKHILVPVDFSEHAQEALRFAIRLANEMSLDLLVLHVVHDLGGAPGFYTPKGHKKNLRKIKELAAERFKDFMTDFTAAHPQLKKVGSCETQMVSGLPVKRILEVVASSKPFMLVMGSAGRTRLANLVLGSKAEQIVRLCPVPVTIIKTPKKKDDKEEARK